MTVSHTVHSAEAVDVVEPIVPKVVKRRRVLPYRRILAPQEVPDELSEEDKDEVLLDELWTRRSKVQSLRLRGFSQQQIATVVGVNQATVSRDMQWIREHRRKMFGTDGAFDSTQEIGEALALFDEIEREALRNYARTPAGDVKDRAVMLNVAMIARQRRLNTLQDQGFLQRKLGEIGIAVRADAVRATLLREGLLPPQGRLGAVVLPDDDPIDAFVQRLDE